MKVITKLNWLDEHTYRMTGFQTYREYLLSPHWVNLREKAKEQAGYRCQRCNLRKPLAVHHKTYDHLGGELWRDLWVLCDSCHVKVHAIKKMKRTWNNKLRGCNNRKRGR